MDVSFIRGAAKTAEFLLLSAILFEISYSDLKTKKIPPLCIAGLFLLGGADFLLWTGHGLLNRAAGFFAVSALMVVCIFLRPGSFGGGDIKMMAAAGFLLGIPEVYRAFCTAVLAAGAFSACLFALNIRKAEIPFGPFLSLGIFSEVVKIVFFHA